MRGVAAADLRPGRFGRGRLARRGTGSPAARPGGRGLGRSHLGSILVPHSAESAGTVAACSMPEPHVQPPLAEQPGCLLSGRFRAPVRQGGDTPISFQPCAQHESRGLGPSEGWGGAAVGAAGEPRLLPLPHPCHTVRALAILGIQWRHWPPSTDQPPRMGAPQKGSWGSTEGRGPSLCPQRGPHLLAGRSD